MNQNTNSFEGQDHTVKKNVVNLRKSREIYTVSSSSKKLSSLQDHQNISEKQTKYSNSPFLVCTSSKTFARSSFGGNGNKLTKLDAPMTTPATLSLREGLRKDSSTIVKDYGNDDQHYSFNQKSLPEQKTFSQYLKMKQNLNTKI